MRPIKVEIIFPVITSVEFACRRCSVVMDQLDMVRQYHESCRDEYPEDWKKNIEDLYSWVERSKELYKHRISIQMIDAQSPIGIWKQIRHRVFKMPAFIVGGKRAYSGWDTERLETLIDEHIQDAAARMNAGTA